MDKPTCTIDGCAKNADAPRGWCWRHYNLWRRHGDPEWSFVRMSCSIDGCPHDSRVRGMCDMHYRRVKKHGDPEKGRYVRGNQCSDSRCSAPANNAGMCNHHYYIKWTTEGRGRELQAAASALRRARQASAVVTERVSWRTLWAAGERSCYLCGRECDPDDFRTLTNRTGRAQKIPGASHPSLDHVIPLSKGGDHSMDNSKLACMRCNREKHARIVGVVG